MANRYWVGGAGTWDTTTTTHWSASSGGSSGASVPTAADSVFFDQASTYTVTVTGALVCLDFTVSAGTVTFTTGTSPTFSISGSMSLASTTVWNTNGAITFAATTTGKTITTNGVLLISNTTFNGVGGGWTLGSAFTIANSLTTTLTNGTLNLGGFTLTTGSFASNNANTRTIAFGSSNISLVQVNAASTVLNLTNTTALTVTGTGGFVTDASTTRTITIGTTGGAAATSPNVTLTGSGTSVLTFTSGSWFNKLDFGTTAFNPGTTTLNVSSLTLSSGGTFTSVTVNAVGTGTLTSNGKTIAATTVNHTGTTTLADALTNSVTATTTLTSGTLDLAGFTLTTGVFSSSNSNTRALAFGSGSIALSHTTAANTVLNMATATGFSVSGTGGFTSVMSVTRTFSFGNTAGGTASNAPNLTLSSGSSVPTISGGSWFNVLDFGTSSGTPSTGTLYLSSLTLGSGVYTGVSPDFYGNGTITPNSKTLGNISITAPVTITSGGSTYFNGTSSYVQFAHNTALDLTSGDFTIECWMCPTAVANNVYLLNKSGISGLKAGAYTIQYRTADNTWSFSAGDSSGSTSGTFYTFGSGSNVLNTWMHLAVVRSGTTIKTFLNGVLITSTTQGTAIVDAGQPFNVGSQKSGGNYYTGYVSNVRVVKGTALYSSNFTPATVNLTAVTNTTLLALQNATTTDNSSNAFSATLFGSPAQSTNDPLPNTTYTMPTTTLSGTLSGGTFTFDSGTLDVTGSTLTLSGGLSAGYPQVIPTNIIGGGTGVISVATTFTGSAGFTGTGYTLNMTNATAKTFAGGGGTYGKLVQAGAGALTITGSNTFDDIQATTRPSTITITAGTTQTLGNFSPAGVSGSLVTFNSSTAGTQYTLRKTSGTASPTYISIRDSNVTGGAYWDLTGSGTNTSVSNNTGWNIVLNKILGQFMTFFF